MLPLWDHDETVDAEVRGEWQMPAYRIALGVELVAHLEPIVDAERLYVGFCGHSGELAKMLVDAVLKENVGAGAAKAHPGMEQDEACDVILPCYPGMTDKNVDHAVLAATKAAHAFFCNQPIN
ncbi:MAG: hypothetical protein HYX51_00130 [Chloroflexi bacterium]|nr:hypothetical protein [Chloroflexota bacterium]